MKYNSAIKLQVINERQKGLSLGSLTEKFPTIPKRTLADWIHGIEILVPITFNRNLKGLALSAKANKEKFAIKRSGFRAKGRKYALNNPAIEVLLAATLYWAEGTKSRNTFAFANCDPQMHKAVWCALKITHPDLIKSVKFSLHLHDGNSEQEAKEFWTNTLESNVEFSYVHHVPIRSVETKWPAGVLTLVLNNSEVSQFYYGIIEQVFGLKDDYFEKKLVEVT